ncbi:MAG: YitT family protein [Eubacterium sp.]|nr:YitT family protein [Eubacterium sp.]
MTKKITGELLIEMLFITIGSVIAAFAIEEFLVGCTILDGGVVGISIMLNTLLKIPLGLLTFLLNIPFLIVGFRKIGKRFIIKSGYAMVVFSIFLQIFAPLKNVTEDYLLAVSFGGVILGIGVGMVIKFGGCLDGTETVAILLNRKFKFPVGQTVLIFNIVIFAVAGFFFGFDRAMYSLLTYFITSKVLDIVENGMEQTKAAMIITNDAKEIAEQIYQKLGRTVTIMEGEGLVSGKKVILYCVLTRFEVRELRSIISNIDSSAFIAISDVSEIIGRHIKKSGVLNKDKENEARA